MKTTIKDIIVFDNPEIFDRYTIINKKTGDMIGVSDNPFASDGFGQHVCNIAYNYFRKTVGPGFIGRIQREDKKHYNKLVKEAVRCTLDSFKSEGNIGKEIPFDLLNDDVKQFAIQSFDI